MRSEHFVTVSLSICAGFSLDYIYKNEIAEQKGIYTLNFVRKVIVSVGSSGRLTLRWS